MERAASTMDGLAVYLPLPPPPPPLLLPPPTPTATTAIVPRTQCPQRGVAAAGVLLLPTLRLHSLSCGGAVGVCSKLVVMSLAAALLLVQ